MFLISYLIITFVTPLSFHLPQSDIDKKAYETAFNMISDSLIKEGSIKRKRQLEIGRTLIRFRLEAFCEKLAFNGSYSSSLDRSDSIKKVYESLVVESDSLNNVCMVNQSDTFSFQNHFKIHRTSSKYVIFFSKVCNNRLQANVFPMDKNLDDLDYFRDYYGPSKSYLFKFDNRGLLEYSYCVDIENN